MPEKLETLTARLLRPETYRQGRLLSVLATLLSDLYRLQVGAEDWDVERIPEHLRLCCKVVDEKGSVLALGRDLQVLKGKLSGAATPTQADFSEYERRDIQEFPASLPDHVVLQTDSGPAMGFPGLCYVEPAQANQGGRGLQKRGSTLSYSPRQQSERLQTDRGMRSWHCSCLVNQHSFFGGS